MYRVILKFLEKRSFCLGFTIEYKNRTRIEGLVQDCNNSIALAVLH